MRKLLTLPAGADLTGISRSSIYRLVREGNVPKPIHVEVPKMTVWSSGVIENWIEEQIANDQRQDTR